MSSQDPRESQHRITLEVEETIEKPQIRISPVSYVISALMFILATLAVLGPQTPGRIEVAMVTQATFTVTYVLGDVRAKVGPVMSVVLLIPPTAGVIAIFTVLLYSTTWISVPTTFLSLQGCVAIQVVTYIWGILLIHRYNVRRVSSTTASHKIL